MKKLMIAAFAAATVCAFADIESTNIVGYQVTASNAGFNFYSPQFKAIGAEQISLQSIKLSGPITDWGDNIQVLDEGGATIAQYYYATTGESGMDEDGWMNDDVTALSDVTIAPGQSVIVETQEGDVDITNAGEVSTADVEMTSVAGFNFVGNSSPVEINIQDIKITGAVTDWGDNIQILDEGGATIAQYYFASTSESGMDEDGWMNDDVTALANVTIKPGQGFIVETQEAGVKITLPSAK